MINETILNTLANICQLADYQMNVQQLSNDDLMQELIKQDRILDYQNNILQEQTNMYLKKIVEQNTEILNLFKERRNAMEEKLEMLDKDDVVHILDCMLNDLLKANMPEYYNKYKDMVEDKLYKITPDEASHIVKEMKPYSEVFSMNTVRSMMENNGIAYSDDMWIKYYLCMNMYANDARQVAEENNIPIDKFSFVMAKSFINDIDGGKNKVGKYFKDITR